jgi:DNA-binding phage protein
MEENNEKPVLENQAKRYIIRFCEEFNYNYSSLAKAVGINPPTIYRWLQGKASITFNTWNKIEDFIGRTVYENCKHGKEAKS